MADQTVKIENDDIASVTMNLARELWVQETRAEPCASDAGFFTLIALCNRSLRGIVDTESVARFIEKQLPKTDK